MFLLVMSISHHHGYRQARGGGDLLRAQVGGESAATLMAFTAVVMAFRYGVMYLDILPKNGPNRWMPGGPSIAA